MNVYKYYIKKWESAELDEKWEFHSSNGIYNRIFRLGHRVGVLGIINTLPLLQEVLKFSFKLERY